MPHDSKGNLLAEGDTVVIRGTIKQIITSEDYCNCVVKLDTPMPPDNTETLIHSINSKQLEKLTMDAVDAD